MARKFKTFVDLPERQKLVHERVWDSSLSSIAKMHLGRLNTLYDQGIKFYHHWDFQKYYTAELRIFNDDISIQLFPADSFYFEFFTTGNPVVTGMVGSPPVSSAKAACVGVNVALQMNAMTVTPQINTGERNYDGTKISQVGRPYQVQLINEPVKFVPSTPPTGVFGRQKYPQVLYESYAPMHSHTGIYTNSLTVGWSFPGSYDHICQDWPNLESGFGTYQHKLSPVGISFSPVQLGFELNTSLEGLAPLNSWNLRDIGFDIPFMYGYSASQVEIAYLNGPTNGASGTYDWPRKNGLIVVNDPLWGTRTFALCIDAFSQFSVFPISEGEIGPTTGTGIQNVQNSLVKSQGPMLPGWCYQMSQTFMTFYPGSGDPTGNQHFPEISWSVHPSGLRACAVVTQQVTPTFDTSYINSSSGTTFNSSFTQQQCGVESRDGYPSGPTGTRYQYGTGLVEVTLTVTLTGVDPGDYTFDATVATLRQPTTSKYCPLLAGYSYIDIQDTCSAGDLIVVDVERWYRPSMVRSIALSFPTAPSNYDTGTLEFDPVPPSLTYWNAWNASANGTAPYWKANTEIGSAYLTLPVWTTYNWNGSGMTEGQFPAGGIIIGGNMVPGLFPAGPVTVTPVLFYWDDSRRTVYSVKNYGPAWGGDVSFTEINSFPGFPSGVKSDNNDLYFGLGFSPTTVIVTSPSLESVGYTDNNGGPPNSPFAAVAVFGPAGSSQQSFYPQVAPPLFSDYSSVILDFDIPTVSFALKLTTWQSACKLLPMPAQPGQAHSFHHSVAIYVKNKLVKQLFPETMSTGNQDAAILALKYPFRDLIGSEYSMIPLNDSTTWGTSAVPGVSTADLASVRAQIAHLNGIVLNSSPATPTLSQAFADWWGALMVYRPPVYLILAAAPSFAWYMYSDLVQNSIHKSPWSTFFVHPNGTWAFFDQSIIYNPYGHVNDAPFPSYDVSVGPPSLVGPSHTTLSGGGGSNGAPAYSFVQTITHRYPQGTGTNFQALWTAFTALEPFEHCIFDWVHLQFTMGDGTTQSVDTSFLQLYNDAVAAIDPNNILDTFNPLTYALMRTTFTPYFTGYYWAHEVVGVFTPAVGQWGYQCAWLGANNFNVGETDPQSITGFSSVDGTRWNFMSLARINTGAYTQPFTFSSCTLVDS